MRAKISELKNVDDIAFWGMVFNQCDIKILPFADTTKWQLFKSEPNIAISNLMKSIIFNGKANYKSYVNPVIFTGLKGKGVDTFDTREIIIYLDRYPYIINGKQTFYANYKLRKKESCKCGSGKEYEKCCGRRNG